MIGITTAITIGADTMMAAATGKTAVGSRSDQSVVNHLKLGAANGPLFSAARTGTGAWNVRVMASAMDTSVNAKVERRTKP